MLDDVFCKQILWPTFHYSTVRKDETTNWEDYVKVNEAFAERIVETVSIRRLIDRSQLSYFELTLSLFVLL